MIKVKFRLWDKIGKEMLTWDWFNPEDNREFFGRMAIFAYEAKRNNKYLMQYTGLKDKNGKEIYEGDILKNGKKISIVFFMDTHSEFQHKWNEGTTKNPFWNNEPLWKVACGLQIELRVEVIGNIYENPELLK